MVRMLMTPPADEDGGGEDEDMEDGEGAWLLRHIPALPCFSLAYPSIASALRSACEIESDPATVSLYIRCVLLIH